MRNHRKVFWRRAEESVVRQLWRKGIPCRLVADKKLPWDIETRGGLHIEVKSARLHRLNRRGERTKYWTIAIARPRKGKHELREDVVDFYVIRLIGGDLRKVYLVLKSPLRAKRVEITPRRLLLQYSGAVNNWDVIGKADRGSVLGPQVNINPQAGNVGNVFAGGNSGGKPLRGNASYGIPDS